MKRLALTAALCATLMVVAQNPQTTNNQQPTTSNIGQYLGVASCANSGCHGSTQPLNATDVLQNEYFTWLNSDRHAGAYNILFDQRSARIARNMRLKKRAYEEKVCLDCHTTNVPANLVAGQIDPEDGVQCEACHGPASGWRAEHTEEGWTRQQGIERGLIDLSHLGVRAHLCHRCHLGNAEKEVDHELIASGHPVLAFEVDNYAESMPVHWNRDEATSGARAWAVGQAMKFRDSLDNLARHARGNEWPEFSDMSCFNCHHSLKGSEWRQDRGWSDRAGLPAWSPQHWAMLRILIGRVSSQSRDELDPLVAQISRGVARMNDPEGVASAAERARKIVHDLVFKIDAMRWSDSDVRALMIAIADERAVDVHTAEQAALSLQSLASVLTRRNPRLLRSTMMQSIDALFEDVKDRENYDSARFAKKLDAVKSGLR